MSLVNKNDNEYYIKNLSINIMNGKGRVLWCYAYGVILNNDSKGFNFINQFIHQSWIILTNIQIYIFFHISLFGLFWGEGVMR